MTTLSAFRSFTNGLSEQEQVMPVLFVGQGSPMYELKTEFSRWWIRMTKEIPVSGHHPLVWFAFNILRACLASTFFASCKPSLRSYNKPCKKIHQHTYKHEPNVITCGNYQ